MNDKTVPTRQGQICKITNPLPDENPAEAYIITEDVSGDGDVLLHVVSLTDLQRHISNPALTPCKAIMRSEFTLIAEDLTRFVESWNTLQS